MGTWLAQLSTNPVTMQNLCNGKRARGSREVGFFVNVFLLFSTGRAELQAQPLS